MAPSLLLSSVLAAAYLIWEPPSADLAAQTFRAELFEDQGFVLWSTAWYGGFHVPGYSVLYPPLAAWLGVRVVGAIAAVIAAGLFAALASRRFAGRALVASLWFAAGAGAWLFTGRMPFLLGVAIGIAALLAADSRRLLLCGVLAGLSVLASPVAGLFTAIAGAGLALTGDRARGVSLGLPALAAIAILTLAFPTGGEEPFVFTAFIGVPLLALAVLWLVPPDQRALRAGVVVYALLTIVAFAIPNPLGGNITRLGALFGGPVLVGVVIRRPALLVALALPVLYWQLNAPVRDTIVGGGDPSTAAAFYEPLLDQLDRRPPPRADARAPARIHVPPTQNRWEAVYVAERFPLARGWLRQLESDDFELFADDQLTAANYRDWLDQHGVSHVAVPQGVDRDHLAEDEVELIDAGLPYLAPEWTNGDWRLYRVADPRPARLRWTPYWQVTGDGCVERNGDWTRIEPADGGAVEIAARLSLEGMLGRDRICSE